MCIEGWAGDALWTAEHARLGFKVRAFECCPEGPRGDLLPTGDILRPENLKDICVNLFERIVFCMHLAPRCAWWTPFANLNGGTRTQAQPGGDGSVAAEEDTNRDAATALFLFCMAVSLGVLVSIEHPLNSKLWKLPLVIGLMTLPGIYVIETDLCAFGHRPLEWKPADGDVRVRGSLQLLTNNPYLKALNKKCSDCPPHKHEASEGHVHGCSRATHKGSYPRQWCRAYASSTRLAFLDRVKPTLQTSIAYFTIEEM